MPLGTALTSLIDIDFTRAQGVSSSGRISFKPTRMRVGTTIVSSFPVVVPLVDGVAQVRLVRLPLGTYDVLEEIDGRPPFRFKMVLPSNAQPVIQYETISPVDPVPLHYTSVKTINGLGPDPTTGNVNIPVIEGPKGDDGIDGVDGADGTDGVDGTDGQDGQDGEQGIPGPPGPPGADGDLEKYSPLTTGVKEWTADVQDCSGDFPHNNGVLLMMRFRWRQASGPLSEIGFGVTSAASSPGAFSGVALYEDGTGVVNRLGQSADSGASWTSQGAKSIPLTAPVAVVKGNYYFMAILWQGGAAGRIAGVPAVIAEFLMNFGRRRSVYLTGQTGFPSTINIAATTGNNAAYWMTAK